MKYNSFLTNEFRLERGLRQGDPLSSYLFLFCMESFSCMLLHAQRKGLIRGIKASQNGPRINHLFSADDALLFVRNKVNEVEKVKHIISNFEGASGQNINLLKSMIYFSPNTPSDHCNSLGNILGMGIVDSIDNYLGLPLLIGKNKTNVFKKIIDNFFNRIRSCSKRLLSLGERKFLLKPFYKLYLLISFLFFSSSGVLLITWKPKLDPFGGKSSSWGVVGLWSTKKDFVCQKEWGVSVFET